MLAASVGVASAQSRGGPSPSPSASEFPTIGTVRATAPRISPNSVNRLNILWKAAIAKNTYATSIWDVLTSDLDLASSWTLGAESKSKLDALLGEKGYDGLQVSLTLRTKTEPNGPVQFGSESSAGGDLHSQTVGALSSEGIPSGQIQVMMTGWKGREHPEEIAKFYVAPERVLSKSQNQILMDERFNNDKRILNIGIVYTYDRTGKAIGCNVLVYNYVSATQVAFLAHDRADMTVTREKRISALLQKPNKGFVLSKFQNIPPGFSDDYIVLECSADSGALGENAVALFNLQNLIRTSSAAKPLEYALPSR